MLQLNGKTLRIGKAFVTEDGRQFPANWLSLASLEEKQSIGIIEVADPVVGVYDQRFYWGVDNPKDLDQLKETWKAKQSEYASVTLSQSDWRVIKARETGGQVPIAWFNYRRDLRAACNTRQAEIDNCADVPALKELLYGNAQIPQTDDDGNAVVDDDGNPVMIDNPNLATPWPTEP